MSNRKKHPEAWSFYEEQARNITNEPDIAHLGNYRIPVPDGSGDFIYARQAEDLWKLFIQAWYKPSLNSHSVEGVIQYVTQHLTK